MTVTHRIPVTGYGTIEVATTEKGEGHPILLLHGGGGPLTVQGFADLLAAQQPARVITPTHPGFGGTPRPDSLAIVAGLAALYVAREVLIPITVAFLLSFVLAPLVGLLRRLRAGRR